MEKEQLKGTQAKIQAFEARKEALMKMMRWCHDTIMPAYCCSRRIFILSHAACPVPLYNTIPHVTPSRSTWTTLKRVSLLIATKRTASRVEMKTATCGRSATGWRATWNFILQSIIDSWPPSRPRMWRRLHRCYYWHFAKCSRVIANRDFHSIIRSPLFLS